MCERGIMMWRCVNLGRDGSVALDDDVGFAINRSGGRNLTVRCWHLFAACSRSRGEEMGKSMYKSEKMEGVAVETRLRLARLTSRKFSRDDLGRKVRRRFM